MTRFVVVEKDTLCSFPLDVVRRTRSQCWFHSLRGSIGPIPHCGRIRSMGGTRVVGFSIEEGEGYLREGSLEAAMIADRHQDHGVPGSMQEKTHATSELMYSL